MVSFFHAALALGTAEIMHMHFNGASSESMACNYLIGLNDEGNTRELFQEKQINKLFVCWLYFNYWAILLIKSITGLSVYNLSPSTNQLTSDIMIIFVYLLNLQTSLGMAVQVSTYWVSLLSCQTKLTRITPGKSNLLEVSVSLVIHSS